jgi:hypothetical protein
MNRCCTTLAAAALIVCGTLLAHAAPPTVTPSPGYDARLQEQRNATVSSPPAVIDTAPAVPPARTTPRHHTKAKK